MKNIINYENLSNKEIEIADKMVEIITAIIAKLAPFSIDQAIKEQKM